LAFHNGGAVVGGGDERAVGRPGEIAKFNHAYLSAQPILYGLAGSFEHLRHVDNLGHVVILEDAQTSAIRRERDSQDVLFQGKAAD